MSETEAVPLWHGRLSSGPDQLLWDFTVSLPYDQRLGPFDIAGCIAHAKGLRRAAVLAEDELIAVVDALDTTGRELELGTFEFVPSDEDIHTAIERRVTELAGDAGAKLHTGRSRNDQVATAFRLFCRSATDEVSAAVLALMGTLLHRADLAGAEYLPGYTHMQHAQPVLLAHHLLAHFWALGRDVDRLRDARVRIDVSPLGAGALAGSSLPLDPEYTARELGFAALFDNSLDATSDRDFAAELLFDLTMVAVHLSRIGEEMVLWSSEEFGFARLADEYSTGSSMLPQKKNPDIAELARGKAGRLIGNLAGLLATLKGLPLAYNRDLQEDKEPVFDAVDTILRACAAIEGMIRTVEYRHERMRASADSPFAVATDLAEYLVAKGMPFRQAHGVVGSLVSEAIASQVDLQVLVGQHPAFGSEVDGLFSPGMSVQRRVTRGGAGPVPVAEQLGRARSHFDSLTR